MMERRIFLWMGLMVLFFSLSICGQGFAEEHYKVKKGDTLAKIAQKYGVSIQSLRNANDLSGSALKPKQTLIIPAEGKKKTARTGKTTPVKKSYYVAKKGDTIQAIAKKTGLSVSEIKRINHLSSSRIKAGQKLALLKPIPSAAPLKGASRQGKDEAELEDDPDELLDEAGGDSNVGGDLRKEEEDSSTLLGTWRSPEERSLFVKVAKGFLGAPYRLGGSSVRGLDCSAFVMKIYQLFDISLPRTAREQAHVGMRVNRGELQEGDLVFFNTRRAFGHVGIYIGNNEFVHASSGRRAREVKIDSLDKPYYDKRFIKAVRLKDVENRDDKT